MSQPTRDQLLKAPKVELHRHLEGAIRYSTLKEWAKTQKLDLPHENDLKFKQALLVREPMKDLAAVLDKFWTTQSMLCSEEVLERMAFEACEDAYLEGIRILELRYSPSFIATNHPNFTYDSIHRAILDGLSKARTKFPMAIGLIGIIGRTLELKEAKKVADFITENRSTFLAMDLADSEEGFDCRPFSPLFQKAKSSGLRITVHSGEANHPDACSWVRAAISELGAERIGHGVQIYKSPETIEFVKAAGVALELCPTSNWLTNAVPSVKAHPFRALLNDGVKVTVNSDDPGIFDIDLTTEYEVLARDHKFTLEELNSLADEAAKASFIPMPEKQKYWPRKITSGH